MHGGYYPADPHGGACVRTATWRVLMSRNGLTLEQTKTARRPQAYMPDHASKLPFDLWLMMIWLQREDANWIRSATSFVQVCPPSCG